MIDRVHLGMLGTLFGICAGCNTPSPHHYVDMHPRFSPDGTRIAFLSERDTSARLDDLDLWVCDSDGTKHRRVAVARNERAFRWLPHGKEIMVVSTAASLGRPSRSAVHLVDVDNGTTRGNWIDPGEPAQPFWDAAAEAPLWIGAKAIWRYNRTTTAWVKAENGGVVRAESVDGRVVLLSDQFANDGAEFRALSLPDLNVLAEFRGFGGRLSADGQFVTNQLSVDSGVALTMAMDGSGRQESFGLTRGDTIIRPISLDRLAVLRGKSVVVIGPTGDIERRAHCIGHPREVLVSPDTSSIAYIGGEEMRLGLRIEAIVGASAGRSFRVSRKFDTLFSRDSQTESRELFGGVQLSTSGAL